MVHPKSIFHMGHPNNSNGWPGTIPARMAYAAAQGIQNCYELAWDRKTVEGKKGGGDYNADSDQTVSLGYIGRDGPVDRFWAFRISQHDVFVSDCEAGGKYGFSPGGSKPIHLAIFGVVCCRLSEKDLQ